MARMTPMMSDAMARLFEDFNKPEEPAEAATAAPPEPTFTTAELAAARLEAWNEGYLAGSRANRHDLGREQQRTFAELLLRADDIDAGLDQMATRNAASIAGWLAATFVATFANLSNGAIDHRTRAVMDVLCSALRAQSKIEVRGEHGPAVSFHSMHDVCRQIQTQQSEDPAAGNITIAWHQGEAEIDRSRIWDQIRGAIMPLAELDTPATRFELKIKPGELIRHVR